MQYILITYSTPNRESVLFTEEDIASASNESDVLFTEKDIHNASNEDLFSEKDIKNVSGFHVIEETNLHDNPNADAWAKEFCKFNTAADYQTMHEWFDRAMVAVKNHMHSQSQIGQKTSGEQLELPFERN